MSSTSSPVVISQALDAVVSPLELQLSSATNQFGLNFMRNLPASAARENVVVSPLSLQIILNLILLGAKEPSDTQAELAKVLGYETESFKALSKDEKDADKKRLIAHEAIHKLVETILKSTTNGADDGAAAAAAKKELDFNLANLMLTNTDVAKPSDEYVVEMKRYYQNTKIEDLKQAGESDKKVHERINSWVEGATKKQISQLVEETDLPATSEIALILLNAANFKGKWLNQFDANDTTDDVFYNRGEESAAKKVKFMHQSASSFSYVDLSAISPADEPTMMSDNVSKDVAEHIEWANKLDCRALSMPFSLNEGSELDMIFVLPNKRNGLPELLKHLSSSPRALALIYKELEEENKIKIQVDLPKFAFESTHDAKSVLLAMGLKQVFSNGAQLDRMFKEVHGTPPKVDKLIHKAKISVDESGAEASAATVAVMSTRSMSWPPREPFTANRPFIFMLRHTSTGLLLFAGSINAL